MSMRLRWQVLQTHPPSRGVNGHSTPGLTIYRLENAVRMPIEQVYELSSRFHLLSRLGAWTSRG